MGQFMTDPGTGGQAGVPPTMPATPGWPGQAAGLQAAPGYTGGFTPEAVKTGGSTWTALRAISTWLKVIAWIELVVGFLFSLSLGIGLGALIGFAAFFLVLFLLVFTAIGFMYTYGSAEAILVFLTIEKNTRKV